MLQIKDTLVSLDLAEQFFQCNLDSCLGECCIEGDAGAPVTEEEVEKIKEKLPQVKEYLLPRALKHIEENGISYVDEEGDLVTQIIDGKNCVFTCYGPGGMTFCALEKAAREGKISGFVKPVSCALYPVRLSEYPTFTAVNYHKWKICKCAEILGKKNNVRLFQFLKEPLTRRFGQEWYDELCLACEAYLEEYGDNKPLRK